MKKYLLFFAFFMAFGAAKAQMEMLQYSDVNDIPMTYTDNGNNWELSSTDVNGTTYEVTWSLDGTTLSYDCTVTGSEEYPLGIHYLTFYDYNNPSTTYFEDDLEDPDLGGTYWHSYGSTDIGSSSQDIYFYLDSYDYSATQGIVVRGILHTPLP